MGRSACLPLIFVLVVSSLLPFASGLLIYFQDNMEDEAVMYVKWDNCSPSNFPEQDGRWNHTSWSSYDGSWSMALNSTSITGTDAFGRDIYHNITLDTEFDSYQVKGYFYDWDFGGDLDVRGIGLRVSQSPCDDDYLAFIGVDSNYGGGNPQTSNYEYGTDIVDLNDFPAELTVSSIARTDGWHEVQYIIERVDDLNDRIRGYLDGSLLFTKTLSTSYDYVVSVSPNGRANGDWVLYDQVGVYDFQSTSLEVEVIEIGNGPVNGGTWEDTNSTFEWEFTTADVTYFTMVMIDESPMARQQAVLDSAHVRLGADYSGTVYMGIYLSSKLPDKLGKGIGTANPLYLAKSSQWLNPDKGVLSFSNLQIDLSLGQTVAIAVAGSADGLVINDTTSASSGLYNTSGTIPSTISVYEEVDAVSVVGIYGNIWYRQSLTSQSVDDYVSDAIALISGGELSSGGSGVLGLVIWIRDGTGLGAVAGGIFVTMMTIVFVILGVAIIGSQNNAQIPPLIYVILSLVVLAMFTSIGFMPAWLSLVIILLTAVLGAPLFSGRK